MMLLTLLTEGRNNLLREKDHASTFPCDQNIKDTSLEDLFSSNKKNLAENRALVLKVLDAGFHSFISGLFPKKNPNSRFPTEYIPIDNHKRKPKMLNGKTRHFHKAINTTKKRI